jgi:polyisoprenoid-binding protein YceI
MKNNVFKILTVVVLAMSIIGCKKKADEAKTTDAVDASSAEVTAVKYNANTTESVIEWKGFKPTGTHNGTINLESGVLTASNGKIQSGTFLIKMNSLEDSENNERLEGHLKSADFFDVEKYPSAGFEVTGFEEKEGKMMLSGNLKLKEKTNNVTFSVTLASEGDHLTLTSDTFVIDRSKWDVKYGSKSFFDDLGEKFINDEIELKITLKATKS